MDYRCVRSRSRFFGGVLLRREDAISGGGVPITIPPLNSATTAMTTETTTTMIWSSEPARTHAKPPQVARRRSVRPSNAKDAFLVHLAILIEMSYRSH
jgi:hypothetical protein